MPPVVVAAAAELRVKLNAAYEAWRSAWQAGEARLAASESWGKLSPEQKHAIRERAGLLQIAKPEVDTPASIEAALSARNLVGWENVAKALPTRVEDALAEAVLLLEPKARMINLPARLLRSQADLDTWLEAARGTLGDALANGPVTPKV